MDSTKQQNAVLWITNILASAILGKNLKYSSEPNKKVREKYNRLQINRQFKKNDRNSPKSFFEGSEFYPLAELSLTEPLRVLPKTVKAIN